MAAERKKLEDQKRQAEIERHRRRLYPEYYAKKDKEEAAKERESKRAVQGRPPSQSPQPPSQALDNIRPVGYFNQSPDNEDAELEALALEAARRKAASEAARRKAEADAAEAARRKAEADTAKLKAEAEAAEASRRKAEAEAAKSKAEAEAARQKAAAEETKRKAAAEAAKQKAAAEAEKEKAKKSSPPATETINVGGKDSSGVPWIIQRLDEQ